MFSNDENDIVPAVVFKGTYPPAAQVDSLTYFGGLPTVPSSFAWPDDGPDMSMHFIGQVNLADLPDVPQRVLLPKAGLLQFFIGEDAHGQEGCLVNFLTEGRAQLRAMTPPKPTWTGDEQFPKWFMQPLVCPTRNCRRGEDAYKLISERFPIDQKQRLPERDWPESKVWYPDDSFPYVWSGVSRWLARFYSKFASDMGFRGWGFRSPEEVGTSVPSGEFGELRRAFDAWNIRSRRELPLAPLEAMVSAEFRDWLISISDFTPFIRGEINSTNRDVFGAVIDDVLRGPQDGWGLLPRDSVVMNTARHTPRENQRHQMFGWKQITRSLYEDPFSPGDHAIYHMLMQFSSDEAFDWIWGDLDHLTFWMTETDMRQGRWDSAKCVVGAYDYEE